MAITKLKIKEESFSFDPKYIVTDEEETQIAIVKKHVFSLRKKATLTNSFGEEILVIKKIPFSFRTTFFIELDEEPVFKITRNFGWKSNVFVESLLDSDTYTIQGNIWSSEYAFYRNDVEFAYVSRKIWSLKDTYGIAILEEFDLHLMIALVIVLDLIYDRRKQ